MAEGLPPRPRLDWRVIAVAALVGVVAVAGVWSYESVRPVASNPIHYVTIFSGRLTAGAIVNSTDCYPFRSPCNATQSPQIWLPINSSGYLGTVLVSLNLTLGPNCTEVDVGGPDDHTPCYYVLFVSSTNPVGMGYQLASNVSVYPPTGSGTWEMPSSGSGPIVSLRLVSPFGLLGIGSWSSPPFAASLTVNAETG